MLTIIYIIFIIHGINNDNNIIRETYNYIIPYFYKYLVEIRYDIIFPSVKNKNEILLRYKMDSTMWKIGKTV
ncbi:hypothetical protein PFBG_03562 [Plasmodium falciparum 7G8]|uniref:Uncharacterized protein n=3 Tax=Plasmodium falciparum TaxID=5833 RepID=A0A024W5V3_PLAFA|nr:hypothetical protein PFTANZ_03506 [Plasmodium falciparum Tanzania (2000708)]ETW42160.1 hypothetical protein PFNF135_03658 [Plasmodium falciparum NF135/5.C10]EUR70335.1 hypothetical protein PFBG_03562 [Plasmodium falciparum 7G8]